MVVHLLPAKVVHDVWAYPKAAASGGGSFTLNDWLNFSGAAMTMLPSSYLFKRYIDRLIMVADNRIRRSRLVASTHRRSCNPCFVAFFKVKMTMTSLNFSAGVSVFDANVRVGDLRDEPSPCRDRHQLLAEMDKQAGGDDDAGVQRPLVGRIADHGENRE